MNTESIKENVISIGQQIERITEECLSVVKEIMNDETSGQIKISLIKDCLSQHNLKMMQATRKKLLVV